MEMSAAQNTAHMVAWLGFFLALIFGYVANKTSFCTMGAVSDVVNMNQEQSRKLQAAGGVGGPNSSRGSRIDDAGGTS